MKLNQNQFSGLDVNKKGYSAPGAIYIATDTRRIYVYDNGGIPRLATSQGAGGGAMTIVDTYYDLPTGQSDNTTAFVLTSNGTQWLPGTLGGTYYPEGWYIVRGGLWVHSRYPVDNQIGLNTQMITDHVNDLDNPHQVNKTGVGLENVDNTADLQKPISNATAFALSNKSNIGHTHTKSEITDFVEEDYATRAEGDLALTALQPGDNISSLLNDEVYLQPGDNISAFVNDAGYITGNLVTSYRSVNVDLIIYSGYLLNSVPVIKKDNYGTVTFAQGVTDLEADWTNRLILTYT